MSWRRGVLAVAAIGGLLVVAVCRTTEPLSWVGGISAWPAQVFRFTALVLGCVFAYHTQELLRDPQRTIGGATNRTTPALEAFIDLWINCVRHVARKIDVTQPRTRVANRFLPADVVQQAAILAVVVIAISSLALKFPVQPIRDSFLRGLDSLLMWTTFGVTIWLLVLVIEVARNQARWYQQSLRELEAQDEKARHSTPLQTAQDRLATLQRFSKLSNGEIYGPFVIIFILCLARWHGFDAWTWPFSLTVSALAAIGAALLAHVHLHFAAIKLRNYCADHISHQLPADDADAADQLWRIREALFDLRNGAFAGPTNHPIVRALVIPIGGFGGLSLLQLAQGFNAGG